MRFRRFLRHEGETPASSELDLGKDEEPEVVQLGAEELRAMSAVFAAPHWLRDLGIASWLIVGAVGLLVGLVWVLSLTATIVEPVLAGLILAVVASPGVG